MLVAFVACLWDAILGEYPNRWHPVVWMGLLIKFLEKTGLGHSPRMERLAGIFIALFVPLVSCFLVYALLEASRSLPFLHFLIALFFLKASFALRALLDAGRHLQRKLSSPDLSDARHELRSLCSRDATRLSEQELLEAGISSLAENLSDSVIAPLFYFLLGGVPLAIAYRAINTLDAMIGYKNHYRHLGWASARLDDLVNWIPARISTLLLLLAGCFLRRPVRGAARVAWLDHRLTPSPNGGWPMATMAGLLGITLRKPGVYSLGAQLESGAARHLNEAISLTRLAGWLGFALALSLAFTLRGGF